MKRHVLKQRNVVYRVGEKNDDDGITLMTTASVKALGAYNAIYGFKAVYIGNWLLARLDDIKQSSLFTFRLLIRIKWMIHV